VFVCCKRNCINVNVNASKKEDENAAAIYKSKDQDNKWYIVVDASQFSRTFLSFLESFQKYLAWELFIG
jgi:hypothetical protein